MRRLGGETSAECCSELLAESGLPERCVSALYDAAHGFRLRNATYRALAAQTMDEQIAPLTASRDLNALVRAGLLVPVGEGRGRYYTGSPTVTVLRDRIRRSRLPREASDPFKIAAEQPQLFSTS